MMTGIIAACGPDFNETAFLRDCACKGSVLFCADGAYERLYRLGILPDVWIGDGDSIKRPPAGPFECVHLPVRKDDTDVIAALRLGLERGIRSFRIHGVLGGRIDHTLGNLQALGFLAEQGADGIIAGKNCTARIVSGEQEFCGLAGKTVSLFALYGEANGVTITGFSYPLNNAVLTGSFPIGVSNVVVDSRATVTVEQGCLLMIVNEL